jgi:hypothetical protein
LRQIASWGFTEEVSTKEALTYLTSSLEGVALGVVTGHGEDGRGERLAPCIGWGYSHDYGIVTSAAVHGVINLGDFTGRGPEPGHPRRCSS